MHMNPYLQLNQEMEDANIFDILAKNTDKDKQNKARERFVYPSFAVPGCLSRIPDFNFFVPSRILIFVVIPDPGSQDSVSNKREG